jgi:hypothetical protein
MSMHNNTKIKMFAYILLLHNVLDLSRKLYKSYKLKTCTHISFHASNNHIPPTKQLKARV